MRKVSKKSSTPIYKQLQEIIIEMIRNEELQPNDPIPTEHELCKIHQISRMTARSAVTALVNEGILYRKQGKGTFVAESKPKYRLSGIKGLTETMGEMGVDVQTKILSFTNGNCSTSIARTFRVSSKCQAIKIERLRIVDQLPYAIETVWLHPKHCRGITKEQIIDKSLYDTLREKYRLVPNYARQSVEPVRLNEYEKSIFKLDDDSLGLLFNRITYTESDIAFEYTKSIYRVDQHKFEMLLKV